MGPESTSRPRSTRRRRSSRSGTGIRPRQCDVHPTAMFGHFTVGNVLTVVKNGTGGGSVSSDPPASPAAAPAGALSAGGGTVTLTPPPRSARPSPAGRAAAAPGTGTVQVPGDGEGPSRPRLPRTPRRRLPHLRRPRPAPTTLTRVPAHEGQRRPYGEREAERHPPVGGEGAADPQQSPEGAGLGPPTGRA